MRKALLLAAVTLVLSSPGLAIASSTLALTFASGVAGVVDSFGQTSHSFIDQWQFTLPAGTVGSISTPSFHFSNIGGHGLALWESINGGATFTEIAGGGNSLYASKLPSGPSVLYRFDIYGTTGSYFNGGSYSGQVNLATAPTVSAVPEPSEWAMLVVGLCIVAWVAGRRTTMFRLA